MKIHESGTIQTRIHIGKQTCLANMNSLFLLLLLHFDFVEIILQEMQELRTSLKISKGGSLQENYVNN